MSDPPRLLRSRLDHVSRRAIGAAVFYEPPCDAKARVWRSIAVVLPASSGVVLGATTTTAATMGSAAATGAGQAAVAITTTVVAKAVAVGLGIGLAVNVAILVPRMMTHTPQTVKKAAAVASLASAPGINAVHSATLLAVPTLARAATSDKDSSKLTANEIAKEAVVSVPLRNYERSSLALPVPRATTGQSPYSDKLREESQLLMRARQALNASDGERALELLAEHHRYFANGALIQESDALEVQALVNVGRVSEARSRARVLDAVSSESPQ